MITTRRRYYLDELTLAQLAGDDGAELLWRALHDAATPATPLPADTPGRAALVAAEYTCTEDVQGARVDELLQLGLSSAEAEAVVALYPA